MASNVARRRLLILGGSGYVGQNVCHAAIKSGDFEIVRSLSRSGMPPTLLNSASSPHHHRLAQSLSSVEWTSGDVLDESFPLGDVMSDVDAVVSCIGAFGSNAHMQRVCGDATIAAIRCAVLEKDKKGGGGGGKGVSAFGFVSSARVYDGSLALRLPECVPMSGYFGGKHRAEEELIRSFPAGHVILRPGFVYGPRTVGGGRITVPLQWIGGPISYVGTRLGPVSSFLGSLPLVGEEISSMVPVESVARAMVESIVAVLDGAKKKEGGGIGAILDAESIRKFRYEE